LGRLTLKGELQNDFIDSPVVCRESQKPHIQEIEDHGAGIQSFLSGKEKKYNPKTAEKWVHCGPNLISRKASALFQPASKSVKRNGLNVVFYFKIIE